MSGRAHGVYVAFPHPCPLSCRADGRLPRRLLASKGGGARRRAGGCTEGARPAQALSTTQAAGPSIMKGLRPKASESLPTMLSHKGGSHCFVFFMILKNTNNTRILVL